MLGLAGLDPMSARLRYTLEIEREGALSAVFIIGIPDGSALVVRIVDGYLAPFLIVWVPNVEMAIQYEKDIANLFIEEGGRLLEVEYDLPLFRAWKEDTVQALISRLPDAAGIRQVMGDLMGM